MPLEDSAGSLLFLSGFDKSYKAETRAFVLRRHLQRRRAEKRRNTSLSYEEEQQWTKLSGSVRSKRQDGEDSILPPRPDNSAVIDRQLTVAPIHTNLGQGRGDPFQTCAIPLNSFEQAMLDQWLNMPFSMHNICRPSCFIYTRDLFYNLNRVEEMLLRVSICYGAWTLESRGVHVDRKQAIQCRQSLYASINHRIATERSNPSWGLLIVVCALISTFQETKVPFKEDETIACELWMHVDGFRSLVRAKGGWKATTSCLEGVRWLCLWTDIWCNGELSVGFVLPPLGAFSPSSPGQYGCFPTDTCLILYAEELVRAYAAFREAAIINFGSASSSEIGFPASSEAVALFRKGTHVYEILASEPSQKMRPICALLLVHLQLQICRSQGSLSSSEWFNLLYSRLDAVDVFQQGSVEALICGLMTETRTGTVWNHHCLESLARHLYVECRLSLPIRQRLRNTLLEFLDVPIVHKDARTALVEDWWTPEIFRGIVFQDLRSFSACTMLEMKMDSARVDLRN